MVEPELERDEGRDRAGDPDHPARHAESGEAGERRFDGAGDEGAGGRQLGHVRRVGLQEPLGHPHAADVERATAAGARLSRGSGDELGGPAAEVDDEEWTAARVESGGRAPVGEPALHLAGDELGPDAENRVTASKNSAAFVASRAADVAVARTRTTPCTSRRIRNSVRATRVRAIAAGASSPVRSTPSPRRVTIIRRSSVAPSGPTTSGGSVRPAVDRGHRPLELAGELPATQRPTGHPLRRDTRRDGRGGTSTLAGAARPLPRGADPDGRREGIRRWRSAAYRACAASGRCGVGGALGRAARPRRPRAGRRAPARCRRQASSSSASGSRRQGTGCCG